MAVGYDPTIHFIAANTTLGFSWAWGNGAYKGPIVLGAAPEPRHVALVGSLGHVEFTATGDLTSPCFYHNSVSNSNAFGVQFRSHAFYS